MTGNYLAFLPHTDLGNAERLVQRHAQDMRFVHEFKRWLVWDGSHWIPDADGAIDRLAKETIRATYEAASRVDGGGDALKKFARRSESKNSINAMIRLAESEPGVSVKVSQLDSDPMLFSVANVTIDLKTGEPRDHRPGDLITMHSPVAFVGDAECPRWLEFLDEIFSGDPLLVAYMKKVIGYLLTGLTVEQVLFILFGTGANGKSVAVEIVRALLGDYARAADFSTFLERQSEAVRNDLARLRGARLVTACEMTQGRHLDEAVIKQITGGDMISARFLYGEFFEFVPQMKVWLVTNHQPHIRGADFGILRRLRVIPFRVTIGAGKRDRHLGAKLREELPGILNWAIQGCHEWQSERLVAPPAVKDATREFIGFMDLMAEFLETCCEADPDAEVQAASLYTRYAQWAKEAGEKRPLARNAFGMALRDKGYLDRRTSDSRYWSGLRIRQAPELE